MVWFVEGVPSFQLLFAVAIALTPLPGLALLQLQEVPGRTVLLALGLLVLALLVAPALMAVPGWTLPVRSLALGAILPALACLEGRDAVTDAELRAVAPICLRHRLRRDPLDDRALASPARPCARQRWIDLR